MIYFSFLNVCIDKIVYRNGEYNRDVYEVLSFKVGIVVI